jgi:hypothetical protein
MTANKKAVVRPVSRVSQMNRQDRTSTTNKMTFPCGHAQQARRRLAKPASSLFSKMIPDEAQRDNTGRSSFLNNKPSNSFFWICTTARG